jgi:hypothetical protein
MYLPHAVKPYPPLRAPFELRNLSQQEGKNGTVKDQHTQDYQDGSNEANDPFQLTEICLDGCQGCFPVTGNQ